jgi:hypothetical protein
MLRGEDYSLLVADVSAQRMPPIFKGQADSSSPWWKPEISQ